VFSFSTENGYYKCSQYEPFMEILKKAQGSSTAKQKQ
jgi:hypothetical protein